MDMFFLNLFKTIKIQITEPEKFTFVAFKIKNCGCQKIVYLTENDMDLHVCSHQHYTHSEQSTR